MSDFNKTTRVGVQRESQDVDKPQRYKRILNIEQGILNDEVKKSGGEWRLQNAGWRLQAERSGACGCKPPNGLFLYFTSIFDIPCSIFNIQFVNKRIRVDTEIKEQLTSEEVIPG